MDVEEEGGCLWDYKICLASGGVIAKYNTTRIIDCI